MMHLRRCASPWFAVWTALAVLSGCALGPDYQRPELPLPAGYRATLPAGASDGVAARVPAEWWKLYRDPVLDRLVADALERSTEPKIAAAQVEETAALLRQTNAAWLPEVDAGANASRSRTSNLLATPSIAPLVRDDRRAALSTSFEVDFWGKLARSSEAARAQALGSVYGREVATLSLVSVTVQTYFTLRSLDAQASTAKSNLATREESLEVVRARHAAGLASALDLNQAIGARADLAAQLADLKRQRTLVEHQLALVTVNAALSIEAGDVRTLPLPPAIPPGLPSELLDRRPDIRVAEQALIAANAQIGVAKSAFLPSVSLTGQAGGQSAALSDLAASGARIWSTAFALSLPVFDAGRTAARVDQARAREQQSLFAYQRAVAVAVREVADAITNTGESAATEAELAGRVDAARRSLELARERYAAGYSPYLEVLDAQRSVNDADLAFTRNRQARLNYSVDLMKSLGGGWPGGRP